MRGNICPKGYYSLGAGNPLRKLIWTQTMHRSGTASVPGVVVAGQRGCGWLWGLCIGVRLIKHLKKRLVKITHLEFGESSICERAGGMS